MVKTLESPLDCKVIKPVYPKGNQSWIFIGRTDAEAEALILWPPDAKIEGRTRRGRQRMRRLDGITDSVNMKGDGEGQGSLVCTAHGVKKNRTPLSNWTTTIHLNGWGVISLCNFDLHFPDSDVKHLFPMFVGHLYIFFEEMSIQVLSLFLNLFYCSWVIKIARDFQKNIYFCFIDYAKAFDCVDHNKLWKILKETGIPDHLTCLLRNLYAGQGATVSTGHGTTDWFQIGKGVYQGCILSLCLFNLYAEYIMRNAGLEEAQAGIKVAGRNNNNLRYADDTTLMAESKEELKSLLMKVKEEREKVGLKLNIQKN